MKRILTALVLIPVISYAVLGESELLFLAVLTAVALFCFYEYEGLVAGHGIDRPGPLAYLLGLAVLLLPGREVSPALVALVALVLALRATNLKNALAQAAVFTLGIFYIFGAWRAAADLRAVSGKWWLLFALALNWAGDIAAMYAGKAFGKHKLAPRVSPGKSWEGAAASVLTAMAAGVAYLHWSLPSVGWAEAAALSAAVNALGQIGDLAESAMKRGAGIKDSGSVLPGHGGFLDRVDSTLFALPAVYLYLRALQL